MLRNRQIIFSNKHEIYFNVNENDLAIKEDQDGRFKLNNSKKKTKVPNQRLLHGHVED